MSRVSFEEFKKEALNNPEIKAEYEKLKPIFELKKKLIKARLSKGLTQEEVAKRMNTKKANISRLESLNNTHVPNLKTVFEYANAVEAKVNINLF